MLTLVPERAVARDERPAYRPFRVEVAAITRLSELFTRVTFRGDQLAHFGTDALDQRIKLVFPHADGEYGDFGIDDPRVALDGTWYTRLRALPDAERNQIRTYTVRGIRPASRELDVDLVVHGHRAGEAPGPAAAWLADAAVGDALVIIGPDARSIHSRTGIDWHPGDAREVLLAGDETAAPAICAILETLPADRTARAFIELPDAAHAPALGPVGDAITWLSRGDAPVGSALEPAVRAWAAAHPHLLSPALAAGPPAELDDVDVDAGLLWESPADEHRGFYAWLAGEAAAIKSLRRFLVTETGIDRHAVAFMGYWRAGQAERQV